jgi:RNA polymerase sigma-70 factor, ECF subfamily
VGPSWRAIRGGAELSDAVGLPEVSILGVTDAEAIARVLDGDSDAYAVLVNRYGPRAARYAARMLGDKQDAEEAIQDAFLRAYRALGRCVDHNRFGPWLFSILINRCRTLGARTGRRGRTFVHDDLAIESTPAPELVDGAVWRSEIAHALAQLDVAQREAFVLKHVEQMSYDEMAELTGVGISALKMRVKRASDHLRVLLQEAYSGR